MYLALTGKPNPCLTPTLNPDFMELCSLGSYCPTVLAKPVTLLSKKRNSQFFETWQTKNQWLLKFLLSAKGKGKNQKCLSKVCQLLFLPSSYPFTQPQLLKISWFSSIKYELEARRAFPTSSSPSSPPLSCSSFSQINLKEEVNLFAWKSSYLDHHLKGEDSCKYIIQVFQSLSGKGKCVLGKATYWNNQHMSKK